MNLAWNIARRYLLARKSHNLINVISWVSFTGVAIGSMGLIIVLSVFNGFGNMVLEMYNSFDPDIRITINEGKRFNPDSVHIDQLRKVDGVANVIPVIEENALLRYRERQYIATLKGVDPIFMQVSGVKQHIIDGTETIEHAGIPFTVVGAEIGYSLGLKINDPLYNITVFLPKKGLNPSSALLDPSAAFEQAGISASGVFSIQQDFDSKYAIVPISFMQKLTGDSMHVTALEIITKPGADVSSVQKAFAQICGPGYAVKDRYQQHDFLYKILRSEKAAVYFILGFILLIATFNLFGTLTILIIDKRKDIHTLLTLGADSHLIRRIFLYEGMLVSLGGALAGMLLGALCCLAQEHWELIRLDQTEGVTSLAYPVSMQATDFVLVLGIVLAIGFSAAWYTSRQIVKRQMPEQLL